MARPNYLTSAFALYELCEKYYISDANGVTISHLQQLFSYILINI